MNVLITGASRGIGLAIKNKFLLDGWDVYSPTRSNLDLANPTNVKSYINTNRHITFDVIVNNAGINYINDISNLSDEQFDEMFQVNINSAFQLIKGFVPSMKKQKYGKIVNIASIFGSVVSKSKRSGYSATKSALIGLTKSLAIELAEFGILANCVSPGYIETDMTRKNNSVDEINTIIKQIPIHKLGTPTDVSDLVYFLCGKNNNYITGQNIIIDGGFSIC